MAQYSEYILTSILTSGFLVLYPTHIASGGVASDNYIKPLQSFILISGLTLTLFGILLLAHRFGQWQRTKSFRLFTGGTLFCLFVAALGAFGSIVQLLVINIFGSGIRGIVVAGSIAGVVVGLGGLLSPAIERLTLRHQILLSIILIVIGSLTTLFQMAIILISFS